MVLHTRLHRSVASQKYSLSNRVCPGFAIAARGKDEPIAALPDRLLLDDGKGVVWAFAFIFPVLLPSDIVGEQLLGNGRKRVIRVFKHIPPVAFLYVLSTDLARPKWVFFRTPRIVVIFGLLLVEPPLCPGDLPILVVLLRVLPIVFLPTDALAFIMIAPR